MQNFQTNFLIFQVIYWDHNSIFMEHRFITKSNDFVNAIVMSRQRLINCSAEDVIGGLLCGQNPGASLNMKPELPLEYVRWIECNDISSANLRNIDKIENEIHCNTREV